MIDAIGSTSQMAEGSLFSNPDPATVIPDSPGEAGCVPVPTLFVRAGAHMCALALSNVAEIMRPLPIAPLAGAPEIVRGLSVIRGAPVPVVDLGRLLGSEAQSPSTRFV